MAMDLLRLKQYGLEPIEQVYSTAIEEIRKRREGLLSPYRTKWTKFNNVLGGGIQRATTYVVGGRPGLGKSAFSNRLLFDMCELNDVEKTIFIYWNFEMPNYRQIVRELSGVMRLTVNDLMSAEQKLAVEHFNKIEELKTMFVKHPIVFMERGQPARKVYEISSNIKNEYPDCHIVNLFDHTRLVGKMGKALETEEERITDLMSYARQLSVEQGDTNILLSQLNRNIESPDRASTGYVPQLTDFFGADSVAQFANVAIILQRPEMYNLNNYINESAAGLLAVHIVKNRDGAVKWIPFDHDLATNTITEREVREIKF